jgi:hypothetical protein
MTNPPPSPYRPAYRAPGDPPSPYAAPQPPYDDAAFDPREQNSSPNTAVGPTPPTQNRIGFAALVLSVLSLGAAFTPVVNFVSFLLGPAGLVCGIVGLIALNRPRGEAIVGTVVSAMSMVIACATIFIYTFGFSLGTDNGNPAGLDVPALPFTPPAETPFTPPPLQPVGTPVPLGTVVELSDADGAGIYSAAITTSVLDADDLILQVEGNTPAPAGMQWAMVLVDVTLLAVSNLPPTSITVQYVAADGQVYTDAEPSAFPTTSPLETVEDSLDIGEDGSGGVVIAIPTEGADRGNWSIQYGTDVYSTGSLYYFEVE